jgi:hypothetical protein
VALRLILNSVAGSPIEQSNEADAQNARQGFLRNGGFILALNRSTRKNRAANMRQRLVGNIGLIQT